VELLDVVALTEDVPEQGLRAGMEGVIIKIVTQPEPAYEIEFVNDDGTVVAMATLPPQQLRPA
jgi:hypothetical protein